MLRLRVGYRRGLALGIYDETALGKADGRNDDGTDNGETLGLIVGVAVVAETADASRRLPSPKGVRYVTTLLLHWYPVSLDTCTLAASPLLTVNANEHLRQTAWSYSLHYSLSE